MCKWCKDEFCTNDKCPYCADYCPVAQDDKICKYRELNATTATDEEYEKDIKRLIGGFPKGSQKMVWDYINSLKERIEDKQETELYSLKMQSGEIDMTISSDHCKTFLASLIQIFDQNGAKNFFTTTIEINNRKGDRYALTIQKMGGQTPGEKLYAQQAENNRLTENNKALFGELRKLCDNVWRAYKLTEGDVNNLEKLYGVEGNCE